MTHDTTPPKRIWADPSETFDGMDVWRSEPGGKGVPYILASEADALVAAALEPVMDLLMEPVATHTDSDWLDRRHDLLVQVTSAPAAAALDKLIADERADGARVASKAMAKMQDKLIAEAEARAAQAGVVERAAGLRPVIPPGLIEALRSQRQLDADGCEVAVSRQACDEAAAILSDLSADPTGVKLLAEMRSERDELRRENGILRGNAKAQGLVDEIGATGKNRRKTEGKLARTIEGQRAALRKLQGVVERHKTRAEAAEAQLAEAQKREVVMREALKDIARQKRIDELLSEADVEFADFEGEYEACIDRARAALSAAPTGEESNG